jgi:hypothetical protein
LHVIDLGVGERIETIARAFGEGCDFGEDFVGAIEPTGEHELERAATEADELGGLGAIRTLRTEGEEVNGFEIEKITADSVVVRKDGSRFALKMQK